MTPDEIKHREKRSAPQPLIIPLPKPEPAINPSKVPAA